MADAASYTIKRLDEKLYNSIVRSHPSATWPIEQTVAWGRFQSELGGRRHLGIFGLYDGRQLLATASLILMSMRGYSYVWINHGPVVLDDRLTADDLLAFAQDTAARRTDANPLFVRLSIAKTVDKHLPAEASKFKPQPAYSHSLLEKTTIVDLGQSKESLLANMKQGGRRALKKANKAGIKSQTYQGSQAIDEFAKLYSLLQETTKRDGFSAHPQASYEAKLEKLGMHAKLHVAYDDRRQPLAWAIVTEYQGKAIYYYGASSAEGRRLMAPYLLHWHIIQSTKASGQTHYDFLGIGSDKYPGLEGVTQFKLRFGGQVVDYPPVYDLPLKPYRYRLWRTAQMVKNKLR